MEVAKGAKNPLVYCGQSEGGAQRPNGVCHPWEHGCALGVARDAVCLFSSESFSSSFFFFSVPFVSWWLVGLAKCDFPFRGMEGTHRRGITRSTFSIQEVGSETAILCRKSRVKEESTDENARLFPCRPGQKRFTSEA